jgi:hypothetical protein
VDEFFIPGFVDLFAEALDIDVDEVGAGIEVVVPDVFADLDATEDAAGGAHEVFEEGELAGGELDAGGFAFYLAGCEVEDEVIHAKNVGGVAGGAADDGVDAGDEFFDVKGFGQVIIGAEVEAFDAFIEAGARGEEDDGDGISLFAESAEDTESVAAGKHDIEDDEVVGGGGGDGVGVVAIAGGVDGEALFFEALLDEGEELVLIFDDEDAHGSGIGIFLREVHGVSPLRTWGARRFCKHDKTVMSGIRVLSFRGPKVGIVAGILK